MNEPDITYDIERLDKAGWLSMTWSIDREMPGYPDKADALYELGKYRQYDPGRQYRLIEITTTSKVLED